MKIRVFEAFAGYGSQSLALERLKRYFPEFDYEVIGISEIDRYAVTAYNALHGDVPNYGDISKIDWNKVPDFDLFTYSFPCTNLSNAGRQEGCEEGSGTASSLLWECRKAIVAKRPRYLLMENVKALVSLKFLPYFLKWQSELVSYGYSNFAKVLNTRDFRIPQNRERIFMVSILDENASYHFPEPFPLDKQLKDVLETDVDEKYYLSKKTIDMFMERNRIAKEKGNGFRFFTRTGEDISAVVKTRAGYQVEDNFIKEPISCAMRGREVQCLTPKRTEYGKKVRKEYESGQLDESRHKMTDLEPKTDGISNTVTTVQKDNLLLIEPKVIQVGNIVHTGNFNNPQKGRVYSPMGISPTIDTMAGGNLQPKILSYTRDANGKVVDRHFKDVANTIHGATGGGGNTDSFVVEPSIVIGSTQKHAGVGSVEGISPCINAACGMGGGQTPMVIYKRHEYHDGDGMYLSTSADFTRAGLPGVSRTIKSEKHDAGVVDGFRIRKLTPRECLRLMDVDDEDIDKMFDAGLSNTQLYKMAGNSIVVNVLYHIFRKMFVEKENENEQLTIF